jgi:hypothetical protein
MDHTTRTRSKENEMNRFLIAIATLVFAAGAMLTPTAPAHAGMKGRLAVGLALGAMAVMAHENRRYKRHKRWKRRHHARRHRHHKKAYVSKKSAPKVEKVAEVEPAPIPELPEKKDLAALVQNENSSISTAALEPVEETASIGKTEAVNTVEEVSATEATDEPKTANKLDCKKFFPAVGMTLSVPCE